MTRTLTRGLFAATTAALLAGSSLAAQAATLVGLTSDGKLVQIDTAKMSADMPKAITGSPAPVVGIDMRPSDGKLYGLASDGSILTIDPASGAATVVSKLAQSFELGPRPVVDFNPVADRLRVVAKGGVSLRIDVSTGAVTVDKPLVFDAADPNNGKTPAVIAGAYTNSMAGAKATELLHLDGTSGALVLQAPPNDGILKVRYAFEGKIPATAAFDIASDANGNTAWIVAGKALHTLDLANGKLTTMGPIAGLTADPADIAAMGR